MISSDKLGWMMAVFLKGLRVLSLAVSLFFFFFTKGSSTLSPSQVSKVKRLLPCEVDLVCLIKVFFAHPLLYLTSLLLRIRRVHPRTRGRSSSKLLAGVPSPHPPDADNANCLLALSCSCSSSLFFLPPPFLGICAEGVYASNFLKTTRPAHSLELGPRLICTLFFLLLPANT